MVYNPSSRYPDLAVLLIDMQSIFLKDIPKARLDNLIYAQSETLCRSFSSGVPVINITFYKNSCRDLGEVIEPLNTLLKQGQVIDYHKKTCDAFSVSSVIGSGLNELLDSLDVRRLFLMGVEASECIFESSVSGISHGFEIYTAGTVIADGDSTINLIKKAITDHGSRFRDIYSDSVILSDGATSSYDSLYPRHEDYVKKQSLEYGIRFYDSHEDFIQSMESGSL